MDRSYPDPLSHRIDKYGSVTVLHVFFKAGDADRQIAGRSRPNHLNKISDSCGIALQKVLVAPEALSEIGSRAAIFFGIASGLYVDVVDSRF